MNNQWKMAPLETTAEMNEAGCQAYMEADGSTWVMHPSSMEHAYNAMLAAAPVPPAGDVEVPPAGDVEVQRWEPENTIVGYNMKPVFDGSFVLHDHYSRDVTRLTAERDGLENALDACDGDRHRLLDKNTYLQSELTKARELLKSVRGYVNRCAIGGGRSDRIKLRAVDDFIAQQPAAPIAHNVDESCGQDAEAAKCARCEASTVESCDEKGCGFLGAGNGAPVAKGGA